MINETIIRRLAFIKYLYSTGITQSNSPVPLKYASILMFHDAIELFFQLSCEHLNAGNSKPNFMDYFEIINQKLSPKELQQRESIRRLNNCRVALKHHGTFPSNLDIEAFRGNVTSFFKENIILVFGTDFEMISLIDFVTPKSSQNYLKKAQSQIQSGAKIEAIENIAMAFHYMISDYEERKKNRFGFSPFYFGKNLTFLNSFFMGFSDEPSNSPFKKLGRFIDEVKESIESMQSAIKIIALGIDYRKYSRFRQFTPNIIFFAGGNHQINRITNNNDKISDEDAQFCLDFVIETSLILNEFDYSITDSKKSSNSHISIENINPNSESGA